MPKYIMVVPSGPNAGCDEEYNRWYDQEHLGDVCAVPGIVSGKRFDALPASPNTPPAPYLAIYGIEADDPATAIGELQRRVETGEMTLSPAIDIHSALMWLYQER